MTYTPLQLDIIRIFGKKDLTFGCIMQYETDIYSIPQYTKVVDIVEGIHPIIQYAPPNENGYIDKYSLIISTEIEILGHEPHLEDVFRVAEERGWLLELKWGMLTVTYLNRTCTSMKYMGYTQLLEQSEETLQQLLEIFKNSGTNKKSKLLEIFKNSGTNKKPTSPKK